MKFKWKELQEQESMQCDDMNNVQGERSIKTCLFLTYRSFTLYVSYFFFFLYFILQVVWKLRFRVIDYFSCITPGVSHENLSYSY